VKQALLSALFLAALVASREARTPLVRDRSTIKSLRLDLVGINASFPPVTPSDTLYPAVFPIGPGAFRRTAFRFVVWAADILDHETVTDTVTVTVP
jgi:hypothetical protein